MSLGTPAPEEMQPTSFSFSEENLQKAREIVAYYPPEHKQSALMPLLWLAQRQHDNWLPRAAMDHVADFLEVPRIRAYEVASFYTMYNEAPVGRYHLQVCTTTPCWLCNSDAVLKAIKDVVGISTGQTSEDGLFTISEVECLGACVNAPMMQVNDDYYEDLDYDLTVALLEKFKAGEPVTKGSQKGRQGAMPASGPTTLQHLFPDQPVGPGAGQLKTGRAEEAATGAPPEIEAARPAKVDASPATDDTGAS